MTYEIRSVPIFSATVRRDPTTGKEDVFDGAWLRKAVKRANAKQEKGYLPPVHVGWHKDYEVVGYLKDMRVEDIDDRPTVVVDITDIPEWVYKMIEKGVLPYRSVQVNDPSKPEISSLALMENDPPYFKFPNTEEYTDDHTQSS